MNVLLVTSRGPCGISDHSDQLIAAVKLADPSISITPSADELDGDSYATKALIHDEHYFDLVVLNFHEALYRNWPVERMLALRHAGYKSVVIYHNTFGEHQPNEMRAQGDHRLDLLEQIAYTAVDAVIVHEPCRGLDSPTVHYWRQGVPAGEMPEAVEHLPSWKRRYPADHIMVPYSMPILGTVGFNLPWKNFDRIAQVSAACGWACLILCANATDEDEARWRALNPWAFVRRGFRTPGEIVQALTACDATIFAYEGAGAGTSGAIRLGLAARKPLIAWDNRQWRDLEDDGGYLRWCPTFDELPRVLANIPIQRCDPCIVQIAERDSWVHLGEKYAELFRSLTCAK